MKQQSVVLIGDVLSSRDVADRSALHHTLSAALDDANRRWGSDLRITVGDEYQGTTSSLGAATRIALDVRLRLLPTYDVRHGIARGATAVLDAASRIEDGPGWWAARAAVDEAEGRSRRASMRSARTAFGSADADEQTGMIEAALLARDELVGRLDPRSLSVLRGLLSGRTQRDIAEEEQISASAVSQRIRHDALGVIVTMTHWMEAHP